MIWFVSNRFPFGFCFILTIMFIIDSTVLAYILKLLNDRHDYGLNLHLLSIDEGISGYRDDSLETVKQNGIDYSLPLTILSYEDLYGWTMDSIVNATGVRNNCTFCGVFRRQALERGANLISCNVIATGHNADDIAETILMNILRGDVARLERTTKIVTSGGEDDGVNQEVVTSIPRCKPFKYTYEKEIVLYARFKKLLYFSTECIYAPNAYRGHVRQFLKDLEKIQPSVILDIIHSGECLQASNKGKLPTRGTCSRCGFLSSQHICKACVLLEGLNTGRPKLGISKSSKVKHIKRCDGCQCEQQDQQTQNNSTELTKKLSTLNL